MASQSDVLLQWARHFITSRKAMTGQEVVAKEGVEGFDLVVESAGKKQAYIMLPDLSEVSALKEKIGRERVFVVTFNTRKNVDRLIENWEELVGCPGLCVMFVNPQANGDQKWALYPSTHAAFSETKKLAQGLNALFSTVEEWTG